ncbi:fimbria/pilus outer membrane usher protein [Rhizobium sp. SAFR-030]|uniref:fimbria/pilus outer membrane usher protein n=1 Tax=Rhizobium sp. SAFR-030 TaxID=3387277 RepID=UPI003F7FA1BE
MTSSFESAAQGLPPPSVANALPIGGPVELQLEVYVNDVSSQLVATVRQDLEGNLFIEPSQLKNVGILPAKSAVEKDGWVAISRLPNVAWEYDEDNQILRFSAVEAARAAKVIDVAPTPSTALAEAGDGEDTHAGSGTGALVNYTLYASTGGNGWSDLAEFQGLSALTEARAFSGLGVLSSSQIFATSLDNSFDMTRLDTTWSYSDEARMMTYNGGDIITGGLAWTRPVRMGGLQVQRNFALRPDSVTMPMPIFAGSAAVPSTVDVYVDNTRRLSEQVPAGPFAITNMPVVTGHGTARIVVRDSLGRETISERPFFASADLLADGLFDFSAEIGYARRSFGIDSFNYDEALVGSATARYGVTDRLTLEGHAEAGQDFYTVGIGGVFNVADYALASLSGATSRFAGETGFQVAGSLETEILGAKVFARTQRTFGEFNDIASVTAERSDARIPGDDQGVRPPKALDQISVSTPPLFGETTLNLSFTQIESFDDTRSRILGVTANRPIGDSANLFVTAYKDLGEENNYGIFAGLSWSFGSNLSASVGASLDDKHYAITTDISRSEGQEIGSYGWRLRGSMGKDAIAAASASYRAPAARLEGGVETINDNTRAYGQVEGSIVVAGGDVFLGERVDDAFGIVDAGAPDVSVMIENRPIGQTNRRGKILLPNLRSYDKNRISIDPTNLPLDAKIDTTKRIVRPKDRAGAIVDFQVETGLQAALITLRSESGEYIAVGAAGTTPSGTEILVGYDGQIFLNDVQTAQTIDFVLPGGGACRATIAAIAVASNSMGTGEALCSATR